MEAATEKPPAKRPRGGHAIFVASGILLSRIAGLIRDRIFAHYFGNSDAAGAFRAALRIPNFLQNLFGEGVLSASFIPVYAKLLAEGEEELAGRVAGIVASLLALMISILVLLGVLLTPIFVDLVAPGFHGSVRELTIEIVRILFPGIGLLVMSAWCLGILNSHRKFFLSYVAPVLWNLAMISTMLIFGSRLAQYPLAIALSWGTVVGAALQFGVQLPFVFKYGGRIRPAIETKLAPVREIGRNLGPIVVSRGVVQLSAYIDGMIASFLGAGAVASLAYAQTLYLLPIGLFGMSVAAAELPEMSSATGSFEEIASKLRQRLVSGQRNIAFFVIPSVMGFLFLGRAIVAALYQTGHFGSDDTLYVWYILMGSTVGLLAATWGRLYSSAFYALRDTKTPLRFAIVRVSLTAVLGVLLAFPLRPALVFVIRELLHFPLPNGGIGPIGIGAVGLTSSAGFAGWIEFLLLKRSLSRRVGSTSIPRDYLTKVWGSALAAGLVSAGLGHAFEPALATALRHHPAIEHIGFAFAMIAVFGAIYFSAALAFGLPELQRVKRLVLRR